MSDTATYRLNQIYNATLELTSKVGIAGLKMSSIAKEAQIASGTLYIYFKNKEELLNELYKKLQQESAPALITEINNLPVNIQLYKMWKVALEQLVQNNHRIVFIDQFLISPYISDANKKLDASFKNYLKDLLDIGKKESLIKDADSDMLISLIIGFLRNFSSYLVKENNGKLTETIIDRSFSLCWEAIKQ